jgi:hypothetical protein
MQWYTMLKAELWERQQPCQQHKLSAALLLLVNTIQRLGCTTTTAVGEPATAAGQLRSRVAAQQADMNIAVLFSWNLKFTLPASHAQYNIAFVCLISV